MSELRAVFRHISDRGQDPVPCLQKGQDRRWKAAWKRLLLRAKGQIHIQNMLIFEEQSCPGRPLICKVAEHPEFHAIVLRLFDVNRFVAKHDYRIQILSPSLLPFLLAFLSKGTKDVTRRIKATVSVTAAMGRVKKTRKLPLEIRRD